MKSTLQNLLLNHINHTLGPTRKVDLYMVAGNEDYSPESCGRILRNLEKSGKIKVEYYKGRRGQRLARYSSLDFIIKKPIPTFVQRGDVMVAVFN